MMSPLEQFSLSLVYPLSIDSLYFVMDMSITSVFVTNLIMCWGLAGWMLNVQSHIWCCSPKSVMGGKVVEFVYGTMLQQSSSMGLVYFPILFTLFVMILGSNMLGLAPYGFTMTSQIGITLTFGLSMVLGIIILGFYLKGVSFLGIFVPSNVPQVLLPFLVVMEVVSFCMRPLSLSLSLCANMMAGHISLHMIGSFCYGLCCSYSTLGYVVVFLMMLVIFVLEAGIAFLQAYVFLMLVCVYLNDAMVEGGHWFLVMVVVGALTSKTYALGIRKWELQSMETCDVFDDLFSSVSVEVYGLSMMSVLPVIESGLSEEWISDVVSFGLEGLNSKSLYSPLVKDLSSSEVFCVSWFDMMSKVFFVLDFAEMSCSFMRGSGMGAESVVVCKELDFLVEGTESMASKDESVEYLNSDIKGVNGYFILNVDLSRESPVLEVMFSVQGIDGVGFWMYDGGVCVNKVSSMMSFMVGSSELCSSLAEFDKSMIVYGYEEGYEDLCKSVVYDCMRNIECMLYIYNKVSGYNMVYEIGGVSFCKSGVVYKVEEIGVDWCEVGYLMCQSSSGGLDLKDANCVIPSSGFLESESLFLNSFGEVSVSGLVFSSPGLASVGWSILMYILGELGSDVLGDMSGVSSKLYEMTPSVFVKGYLFGGMEFMKKGNVVVFSFLSFDFFVNSYYAKVSMDGFSSVLKLSGFMESSGLWTTND